MAFAPATSTKFLERAIVATHPAQTTDIVAGSSSIWPELFLSLSLSGSWTSAKDPVEQSWID